LRDALAFRLRVFVFQLKRKYLLPRLNFIFFIFRDYSWLPSGCGCGCVCAGAELQVCGCRVWRCVTSIDAKVTALPLWPSVLTPFYAVGVAFLFWPAVITVS